MKGNKQAQNTKLTFKMFMEKYPLPSPTSNEEVDKNNIDILLAHAKEKLSKNDFIQFTQHLILNYSSFPSLVIYIANLSKEHLTTQSSQGRKPRKIDNFLEGYSHIKKEFISIITREKYEIFVECYDILHELFAKDKYDLTTFARDMDPIRKEAKRKY